MPYLQGKMIHGRRGYVWKQQDSRLCWDSEEMGSNCEEVLLCQRAFNLLRFVIYTKVAFKSYMRTRCKHGVISGFIIIPCRLLAGFSSLDLTFL
jgi:hypothetical protein